MHRFRMFVFRLYERPRLRNWFYTLAFAVFVPVGYRFASLAWQYGSWIDKPLSVIAGIFVGITALVTLMRIWKVPPHQIATPAPSSPVAPTPQSHTLATDVLAAARQRAALNRAMALDAAALGSTLGKARYR
jgi:hypothetical protein